MVKIIFIITIFFLVIYYLVHRFKILKSYKRNQESIYTLELYKSLYDCQEDCPRGYRVPSFKEFETHYVENEFDISKKYIKVKLIICDEDKMEDSECLEPEKKDTSDISLNKKAII